MENHLPVQTRVGPVHLLVADLERALSLYEDVLAMQRRDLPDGSVALAAAQSRATVASLMAVHVRQRFSTYVLWNQLRGRTVNNGEIRTN